MVLKQNNKRFQGDAGTDRALSLWVVFAKAFDTLSEKVSNDIRQRGFKNLTEWAVLEYLYHRGRQPLGRIGEHILITSGSVTYVIDKLEDQDLIKRRPCPEDRRIIYGELTEQGREIVEREFPGHAEAIRILMNALTPSEQETLRVLLKKLGLSAVSQAE